MPYAELERGIHDWAAAESRVNAVVVYGSRASAAADDWSDLDLVVLVTELAPFVAGSGWLDSIGHTWVRVLDYTGHGDPEWFAIFEGGLKVDFIFSTAASLAAPNLQAAGRAGLRVLLAKGGAAQEAGPVELPHDDVPGPAEFAAGAQAFWLGAYRAAIALRRGDLWRARILTDGPLRQQLQTMAAWHSRAVRGVSKEPWQYGRYLENWTAGDVAAVLPALFGGYTTAESRRSLLEMAALYARLAAETAEKWKYPQPEPAEAVQSWLRVFLDEA